MRQVTVGRIMRSKVMLCIDQSAGSWDRLQGCRFRNRIPSLLWSMILRLAESWWPILFSFFPTAQKRKLCERLFFCFRPCACNSKSEAVYGSIGYIWFTCFHRGSWLLSHFIDCKGDLILTYTFDLGYLGHLSSWKSWEWSMTVC